MDKKMIDVEVNTIFVNDLEGEVVEVTKRLLEMCEPGDRLDWQNAADYYGGSGDFRVLRRRLETDEEYALRLDEQQKSLEQIRKFELAQLERLKKKYENG